MTRDEKIISFFKKHNDWMRWCTAGKCGCAGCINGSARYDWKETYPEETPITQDEFDRLKLPMDEDNNFKFVTITFKPY